MDQLPPEHDELHIRIYLSSIWFWLNTIYRSSPKLTQSATPCRTLMYWKKIHLYVNILQLNSAMENHQKSKLNIKQRFSCGLGDVLNEISRQMYISFSIIFLMRVIGLSASQARLAMLIGQITDAFTSPITGFLGHRVQIPFLLRAHSGLRNNR